MFAFENKADISWNRMVESLQWGSFLLAIFFFELLLLEKGGSSIRPDSGFPIVSLILEILLITLKGRKAFPHMSWTHTHIWYIAGVHTASILPSLSLKKKIKTQQQSPKQGMCMNDSKSAKTCCNPCLFTNVLNTSTAFRPWNLGHSGMTVTKASSKHAPVSWCVFSN